MQNTVLHLNECIFSEENDKRIFSEDCEKEQIETAKFAADSIVKNEEQLDSDDFVLDEPTPSIHGNQSLSPDTERSEEVTPEELLDMIENTSDFEETKVHMVNEAIDGLDLEFRRQ